MVVHSLRSRGLLIAGMQKCDLIKRPHVCRSNLDQRVNLGNDTGSAPCEWTRGWWRSTKQALSVGVVGPGL